MVKWNLINVEKYWIPEKFREEGVWSKKRKREVRKEAQRVGKESFKDIGKLDSFLYNRCGWEWALKLGEKETWEEIEAVKEEFVKISFGNYWFYIVDEWEENKRIFKDDDPNLTIKYQILKQYRSSQDQDPETIKNNLAWRILHQTYENYKERIDRFIDEYEKKFNQNSSFSQPGKTIDWEEFRSWLKKHPVHIRDYIKKKVEWEKLILGIEIVYENIGDPISSFLKFIEEEEEEEEEETFSPYTKVIKEWLKEKGIITDESFSPTGESSENNPENSSLPLPDSNNENKTLKEENENLKNERKQKDEEIETLKTNNTKLTNDNKIKTEEIEKLVSENQKLNELEKNNQEFVKKNEDLIKEKNEFKRINDLYSSLVTKLNEGLGEGTIIWKDEDLFFNKWKINRLKDIRTAAKTLDILKEDNSELDNEKLTKLIQEINNLQDINYDLARAIRGSVSDKAVNEIFDEKGNLNNNYKKLMDFIDFVEDEIPPKLYSFDQSIIKGLGEETKNLEENEELSNCETLEEFFKKLFVATENNLNSLISKHQESQDKANEYEEKIKKLLENEDLTNWEVTILGWKNSANSTTLIDEYNRVCRERDTALQEKEELEGNFSILENDYLEKLEYQTRLRKELDQAQKKSKRKLKVLKKEKTDSTQQINSLNQKLSLIKQEKTILAGELKIEKTNHTNTQAQLTTANNTINQAQTTLGIANLNNLPNLPAGKNLTDLINYYNNPTCRILEHQDYDAIKDERNQLRQHDCSCPHTDYQEIKQQRDQAYQERDALSTQLTTANQENQQKEQQIIHQINQDLKLDLKEPNLEQLITKIQELINKPPRTIYEEFSNDELEIKLNQAQQTINKLEKELGEKTADAPFEVNLEAIKQSDLELLTKIFSEEQIPDQIRQEIIQATNYQQVVAARQAFLQKHLEKEQNKMQMINQTQNELIKQPNKERIIWIGLLITALLTISWLLFRKKRELKNDNQKK